MAMVGCSRGLRDTRGRVILRCGHWGLAGTAAARRDSSCDDRQCDFNVAVRQRRARGANSGPPKQAG